MTRDYNIKQSAVAANTTFTVPAGYMIEAIVIKNNTANAITGGLRFGSTDGGAQVITAQAVGANAYLRVADAALLLAVFAAEQIVYVQAVTAWNSANVDLWVVFRRLDP